MKLSPFECWHIRVAAVALALFVLAATITRMSKLMSGDWWSAVTLLCYASLLYTCWLMWKAGRLALRKEAPDAHR